jgi:hypothetical protein
MPAVGMQQMTGPDTPPFTGMDSVAVKLQPWCDLNAKQCQQQNQCQ